MYLDEIIIDPIHDILHRLRYWTTRAEQHKSEDISDTEMTYLMFLSDLNEVIVNNGTEIAEEFIKYAILSMMH